MTINAPHFERDIIRLEEHLAQGLIQDILTHQDGKIGSVSNFAVTYKPGAVDRKGKMLHNELWYRGVRYIATDRPVFFKVILADLNRRVIPQSAIVDGFLYKQAILIKDNPPAGFINDEKPWLLQNYRRCWAPIVSEIDLVTHYKP